MRRNILLLPVFVFLFFACVVLSADVKEASLAGTWYPGSKTELSDLIKKYLHDANPEKLEGDILVLISPHAGYQFSGPVAAYGFKAVEDKAFRTVVVIGFNHRKHFDGIAVFDKGIFRTPLGDINIDESLAKDVISQNPRIRSKEDIVFNGENSVEIQIPFIQMAIKDAKIIPVAFGTQDYRDAEILAQALAAVLKDRKDMLIVASTDMSHFHPYEEANSIDRHTMNLLNNLKAKELYDEGSNRICELCGLMPVTSTLLLAEKLGYNKMKVLKYANSGDTFGNKESVVGYLSAVIYKEGKKEEGVAMLNDTQRKRLLQIARESIISYVKDKKRKDFKEDDPVLNTVMGAFVTLHESGELRGCIGNIVGQGPLYQTVADMAIEAATGDPRFQRLSPDEIDKIDIEISALSPLEKVSSYKEINIPGHGVVVRSLFGSGVYLPQVATETRWNREEFLTSLCAHKAGLPADAWKDPKTELYVFSAEVFGEKDKGK